MTDLGVTRADRSFLEAFETCRLPPEDWTHEAHVRVAWIALGLDPPDAAVDRVRTAILRYNTEVLDRAAAYHDTLTVAYVRIIAARRCRHECWKSFRERNADLLDFGRPATARYYSASLMGSEAAKCRFLEPDLEPLPDPGEPE